MAPIWDTSTNVTNRVVWIPPGEWEDVWSGATVSDPKSITASQPFEKQPMWHKKDGGLTVITDSPGLRIADGDWSSLTIEAFPALTPVETVRSVYALGTAERTDLRMQTDGQGLVSLSISESTDKVARTWIVRLHLRVGQRAVAGAIDGKDVDSSRLVHLQPMTPQETVAKHFPFAGSGARPPALAGSILELEIEPAAHPRFMTFLISQA